MKIHFFVAISLLLFTSFVKAETCLPVQGLQFEKIGYGTLLIIKNGQNWGTLVTYEQVPEGNLEFRFFTPTICDGFQNSKFHINSQLFSTQQIQAFK